MPLAHGWAPDVHNSTPVIPEVDERFTRKSVIVVGAGIAGVMTAWYLKQAGHSVMVLEQHREAALESSFMNSGLLCPSLTYPWSSWGVLRSIFRNNEIKSQSWLDPLRWSWAFVRAMRRFELNFHRSWELSRYSLGLMTELLSPSEYRRFARGSLQMFSEEEKRDEVFRTMEKVMGCSEDLEKCDDLDLGHYAPFLKELEISGSCGIYSRGDTNGDVNLFTSKCVGLLRAQGVAFSFNTKVSKLNLDDKHQRCSGVTVLSPLDGKEISIDADDVVVACGHNANGFACSAGDRLLSQPVKGCILEIGVNPGYPVLRQNVVNHSKQLCASPMYDYESEKQFLRISRLGIKDSQLDESSAGDLELSQSEAMIEEVEHFFPKGYLDMDDIRVHECLAPQTPDDLPVIGQSSFYKNLWYNAGHGHIGWTRGFASGRVLSDLITGKRPQIEYECYSPHRFLPWWGKMLALSVEKYGYGESAREKRDIVPGMPGMLCKQDHLLG